MEQERFYRVVDSASQTSFTQRPRLSPKRSGITAGTNTGITRRHMEHPLARPVQSLHHHQYQRQLSSPYDNLSSVSSWTRSYKIVRPGQYEPVKVKKERESHTGSKVVHSPHSPIQNRKQGGFITNNKRKASPQRELGGGGGGGGGVSSSSKPIGGVGSLQAFTTPIVKKRRVTVGKNNTSVKQSSKNLMSEPIGELVILSTSRTAQPGVSVSSSPQSSTTNQKLSLNRTEIGEINDPNIISVSADSDIEFSPIVTNVTGEYNQNSQNNKKRIQKTDPTSIGMKNVVVPEINSLEPIGPSYKCGSQDVSHVSRKKSEEGSAPQVNLVSSTKEPEGSENLMRPGKRSTTKCCTVM